ncbi:hypothetical protein DEU29_10494 [Idiomarina aquatica]|uniref:Uncharacterized protein n=1 Tax=Idiomarina aquatica TaxID=1327752 RepID=A0A4R6PMD9_9GAMM|nr:hypothetical protein DEU29_10494 [Idiomarina aquatica]
MPAEMGINDHGFKAFLRLIKNLKQRSVTLIIRATQSELNR